MTDQATTNTEQEKQRLEEVFETFLKHFSPAQSPCDANYHITSQELYNKIFEHYPSPTLSVNQIYDYMKSKGYKFRCLPGKVEFIWMMTFNDPDVL